eukprot:9313_1
MSSDPRSDDTDSTGPATSPELGHTTAMDVDKAGETPKKVAASTEVTDLKTSGAGQLFAEMNVSKAMSDVSENCAPFGPEDVTMSDVGPARSQPGSDYQTDPSSSEALSQSQESDCFLKLQTCLNMANMDEADDLFDGSDLRDLETLLQEKEHSLEKAIVSAHCLKFITKSSDKAPAISFSRSPAFKHFMDLVAIYGKDEQFRSFAIQTIRNLGEIPDVIPCMGEHSDTIAALSSDLSAIFKVHSSPKAEHVPPPQEESTFAVPVRTSQGLPNTNLRVTVPRTSISSTSSGRSSINSRLSHFDSPLITPSRKSAPQLSTPTALSTPSGHSDTSSKQGEGSPVSTPVPSSEG